MNSFPRRSPRFQQQVHDTQSPSVSSFPSFSQASSTISTSHPSPTNNLLNQPQQYPVHFQSQFLSPHQNFEAPLPSPSATDLDPYFGSSQSQYNQHMMSGQSQQNQNTTTSYQSNTTQSQTSQSQNTQHQQQQSQHHHNSFSQPQRANYPPAGVNGVPPGLPPDFLAEAAKRAQMACLMRDLGDVSL